MPYDPVIVQPMREELTRIGFRELRTPEEVDRQIGSSPEPVLLVINSVCGCAAGVARPGVAMSLQHPDAPKHRATVFAGQDCEATARARSYFGDLPPSSPQVAILSEGKLLYLMPRSEIEGRSPAEIAAALERAYERVAREASAPEVVSRKPEAGSRT